MSEWWEGLTGVQQFFYYIAIPSTVIMAIQFVLSLMGMQDDSSMDMDNDLSDMDDGISDATDFRFVTFRGIIAFLTIFGWVGSLLAAGDVAIPLTIIIATISGLIAMTVVALMFYAISRLQANGNIQYKNALGAFAEVYIPIPPKNSGVGKVQIMIQERLIEADAMTFSERSLKTGEIVRVVDLFNQTTLVVEKEE